MSDAFYQEMQDVATEVLGEFEQGLVQLEKRTVAAGAEPWNPAAASTELWTLAATVAPLGKRLADGETLLATDSAVVFGARGTRTHVDGAAVSPVEGLLPVPTATDVIWVDGVRRTIKQVFRVPEAGVVVAWRAVLGD